MEVIEDLLRAFKSLLDDEGKINVLWYNSLESGIAVNSFNPPVGKEDLAELVDKHPDVPSSYIDFLKIHNGASLFESYSSELKMNIGGGCYLYSAQEIININAEHPIPDYLILGSLLDGQMLLINKEDNTNSPNERPLVLWGEVGDLTHLHVDFTMFLHRYLTAQGASFWEWPNESISRYKANLKHRKKNWF
ncbi:SMI1/KNR4 family protein [Shouchella clausii]|uniref:SMI1/KNR4 family protein n=1 Tax=Shouchella clausii TaxID=79880 RepID=UPI000BA69839|nr:SMI1/KNR4 family protein [Shouchella clausii]PAE94838.1 hypothetical protein CHH70_07025 [Shouchella clausii]